MDSHVYPHSYIMLLETEIFTHACGKMNNAKNNEGIDLGAFAVGRKTEDPLRRM